MDPLENSVLLHYNLDTNDVADGDFAALFERRRRDACFAAVWREGDDFVALRDHLGTVPLWYRRDGRGWRFALQLDDLVEAGDSVDETGLRYYLGLGSCKIVPLFDEIGIVPPGTALRLSAGQSRPEVLYEYSLAPRDIPRGAPARALADELRALFKRAIERTLRCDEVGLFLSGGVDSCLIGVFLRELGVHVHAFTSARWGNISSEFRSAARAAEIVGVSSHQFDRLETENYRSLFAGLGRLYRQPHGTATSLGVVSLLRRTDALEHEQLYFGQNMDTMTCSMRAQYLNFFASWLPGSFRRAGGLPHERSEENYLHYVSNGLVDDFAPLQDRVTGGSTLQRLTAAGMFFAHTPPDGEVIAQPVINAGRLISNPCQDMDLIEFNLGMPLHVRISLRRQRFLLSLEKRLWRRLALSYLPADLIRRYSGKGFNVPFNRDERSRDFARSLPVVHEGIRLPATRNRFAAAALLAWGQQNGIRALQGRAATPAA